ncbi:hypothetical protein KSP39_PZI018582 [Platanthera zijinensis]|uniref:Uncharacterized protein n=1 Tax=Platanthera zijinensis TaxID=2320716 RepID=A0AAP0FYW6_9ASPA
MVQLLYDIDHASYPSSFLNRHLKPGRSTSLLPPSRLCRNSMERYTLRLLPEFNSTSSLPPSTYCPPTLSAASLPIYFFAKVFLRPNSAGGIRPVNHLSSSRNVSSTVHFDPLSDQFHTQPDISHQGHYAFSISPCKCLT